MTEPMSREALHAAKRERDAADLDEALRLIRTLLPTARTVDLATSDQGLYGFVLMDVTDAEGVGLLGEYGEVPGDADNAIADLICDLDWDGVVGEDQYGYATIEL